MSDAKKKGGKCGDTKDSCNINIDSALVGQKDDRRLIINKRTPSTPPTPPTPPTPVRVEKQLGRIVLGDSVGDEASKPNSLAVLDSSEEDNQLVQKPLTKKEVADCYRYGILLDDPTEIEDARKCRLLPKTLNIPPAPGCNFDKNMDDKFNMWTPSLPVYYERPGTDEINKISPIITHLFLGAHNSVERYKEFDVVINCDWPCNRVKLGEMKMETIVWPSDGQGYGKIATTAELLDTKGKIVPNASTQLLKLGINDTPTQNIIQYFDTVCSLIMTSLKMKRRVLVHCHAGVSRSASFVIAFFIRFGGFSLRQAIEQVKSSRSFINPNDGFLLQLQKYTAISEHP